METLNLVANYKHWITTKHLKEGTG